MKQYNAIKNRYPDAMLLFRVGDFYETFGEDAKKALDSIKDESEEEKDKKNKRLTNFNMTILMYEDQNAWLSKIYY